MNRISNTPWPLEVLLDGLNAESPIEALLLDRARLIRILQRSLAELHEHRRLTTGTPDEVGTAHLIKYWDAVLGWVKAQPGPDVIVMNRAE